MGCDTETVATWAIHFDLLDFDCLCFLFGLGGFLGSNAIVRATGFIVISVEGGPWWHYASLWFWKRRGRLERFLIAIVLLILKFFYSLHGISPICSFQLSREIWCHRRLQALRVCLDRSWRLCMTCLYWLIEGSESDEACSWSCIPSVAGLWNFGNGVLSDNCLWLIRIFTQTAFIEIRVSTLVIL